MNKQFEEWLKANAIYKDFMYKVPFSMQWGVYLSFFDSVGLCIEVQTIVTYEEGDNAGDGFLAYVNWDGLDNNGFNTRQEAQQEAIKKAFDLLESK